MLIKNVFAQCDKNSSFSECLEGVNVPGLNNQFPSEEGFIGNLITTILPIILALGGFITVVFIIISGIQFITSSGDPEAAGRARGRLIYAIIGFIVIILSFAILQIVDTLFLGGSGIV